MKSIRWILFVPIAALGALLCGYLWSAYFPKAYFAASNIQISILGLAPLFLGKLAPVALFVLIGTAVVPKRTVTVICLLGILGGIFGVPFGPQYSESVGGATFYATEVIGAASGSAVGMLLALNWRTRKPAAQSARDAEPVS